MRRRKLYRNPMFNPRRIEPRVEPDDVDPAREAYERGLRQGMQIASMQQVQKTMAIVGRVESTIARAQQEAFDRGYRAAARVGPEKAGSAYTYADIEAARSKGFEAGRKSSAPVPSESAIKKKLVDQMIEECRVIAESNPNMAPGVNAVRHRIKKLGS